MPRRRKAGDRERLDVWRYVQFAVPGNATILDKGLRLMEAFDRCVVAEDVINTNGWWEYPDETPLLDRERDAVFNLMLPGKETHYGMARTKQGDLSRTKIPYDRWLEGREALAQLRKRHSWTEIGRAMGKDSKGWAAEAYQHRSIMSEQDVVKLLRLREADLLTKDVQGKEKQDGDFEREVVTEAAELSDSAQRLALAKEIASTMREDYSASWQVASQLFGLAPDSLNAMLRQGNAPSWKAIDYAQGALRSLEEGVALDLLLPVRDEEPTWLLSEAGRDGTVRSPARNGKHEAPAAPEVEKPTAVASADPFAWMDKVRDGLIALAYAVEEEAKLVPDRFRGPYVESSSELVALAEKYER